MENFNKKRIISKLFLLIAIAGVLCFLALGSRSYSAGQRPAAAKPRVSTTPAAPTPAPLSNFSFGRYTGVRPFILNTLPTTRYGPPWADIVTNSSNMLECKGKTAPIALCYYSGSGPTTPCTLDGLGLANCTCYEIPAGQTYSVHINAILNRDVYLKTVAACGKNGEKCQPTGSLPAPVCAAINNNTLIPGADLISTFSLYLEKQIPIHETSCATDAAYAGCMTAPCKRTGKTDPATGLPLVQCGCPTFTGPYQVGTATDQCVLGGNYVWSAAYKPPPRTP